MAVAGLRTHAQPAANAGPILCATRFSGKLNGEIAPTTPIGRRTTIPVWSTPAGCASIPISSPPSPRASCAEKMIVCTARSASTCAVAMGFPASCEIVRASSSRRSRRSPATRSSTAARSCAGTGLSIAFARRRRPPARRRRGRRRPPARRRCRRTARSRRASRPSRTTRLRPGSCEPTRSSSPSLRHPFLNPADVSNAFREPCVLAIVDRDLNDARRVELERPPERRARARRPTRPGARRARTTRPAPPGRGS